MTISAAAAYRLDTAARNLGSAVDDADRAIVAAAVLQHAAMLPAPQRPELLRDAIEVMADGAIVADTAANEVIVNASARVMLVMR